MTFQVLEGVVENGQIKIAADVQLRDRSQVYVIVRDSAANEVAHVYSPRLRHPSQAEDFKMEVIEQNAKL